MTPNAPSDTRNSAFTEDEFPILRDRIFFNHAAVSPLPARSAQAMRTWIDQAETSVGTDWPLWAAALRRARRRAADLLHADTDEICFVRNTTHGLLIVANGLDWRPGDNVIFADREFPANVYPWKDLASRGVANRIVQPRGHRFEVDDFIEQMDQRTRLVAVSLVQYNTGFRMPVEKLAEACRERGILLCVDAIQAVGALPVNVRHIDCDFLAADGHKWMMAPEGFGLLYIRKASLEKLNNSMAGWVGRIHPTDYDDLDQPLADAAKKFEDGSHAMALAVAFEKSLEVLEEVGEARRWELIQNLTSQLTEGLRTAGFDLLSSTNQNERSGIIVFNGKNVQPANWLPFLQKLKVDIAARGGGLRVAPHFYNNSDQVTAFLEAITETQKHFE